MPTNDSTPEPTIQGVQGVAQVQQAVNSVTSECQPQTEPDVPIFGWRITISESAAQLFRAIAG